MAKVGRPKGTNRFDTRFILSMEMEMKLKLDKIATDYEVSTAELIRKALGKVIQYA